MGDALATQRTRLLARRVLEPALVEVGTLWVGNCRELALAGASGVVVIRPDSRQIVKLNQRTETLVAAAGKRQAGAQRRGFGIFIEVVLIDTLIAVAQIQ